MRFINVLLYDIRYGLLSKPQKWLVPLFFFAFLFLSFTFDVFHLFYFDVKGIGDINTLSLSFGDVLMVELGGKLPMMTFSAETSFQMPTSWLLAHILICYLTLHYLSEDLSHGGIQVLSRVKNKNLWWFSKILWNIASVVSYYLIGFGVLYLLCVMTGKNSGFALNQSLFSAVFSERLPDSATSDSAMFLGLCALPCIVGITMNLMQMTLTLFVKPIFAFVASCVYFIAGLYYAHSLMIANYAMPVRSEAIGIYNFHFASGLCICIAFCLIAVIAGAVRLRKMDIVNNA